MWSGRTNIKYLVDLEMLKALKDPPVRHPRATAQAFAYLMGEKVVMDLCIYYGDKS